MAAINDDSEVQQLRQRVKDLERQQVDSSFDELVEYYHESSKKMKIETDPKKSTQGNTTSPKGRSCPTILREWTSFPAERDAAMKNILEILRPEANEVRCFEPKFFVERLVNRETEKRIASEEDLRIQLHILLDMPTAAVATKFVQSRHPAAAVRFRNHDNFGEEMLEVQQHHDAATAGAGEDCKEYKRKSVPIDQVCLLDRNEHMRPLFLSELKPPHKMTRDTMYSGLDREVNLPNEIISASTIPTDPHEKSVYTSKQMVCAAITQAYEYMLRLPVTHACLVTGETIVFLRIDYEDTNILYYYLVEPLEAVAAAEKNQEAFPFRHAAVAQLVAFTILALDAPVRDQNWKQKALAKSAEWHVDPDVLLSQLHEEQTKETPPPSVARIRFRKLDDRRSPIKTRLSSKKSMQSLDHGPSGLTRRRTPPGSDDDESDMPDTPTQRGQVSKRGRPSKQGTDTPQSSQQQQQQGQQKRQYCTQACLFGLTHGLPLDTQCPNLVAHRSPGSSPNHALTQSQLVEAFREQLGHDLVAGVEELNLKGRRGALFRLELLSHGYVVVAKACISILAPEFRKEGQVYNRLESLQGDMIPVFLGNFDMINPWIEMYYSLTHMLLMSHAGRDIQKHEGIDIERYAGPYVARCAELGVFNNDLHRGNVLWNEERKSVMFIDLGEVTLFEPPAKSAPVAEEAATPPSSRRILQELEVNMPRVLDPASEAPSRKRKWVFTEEIREEYLTELRERKARREKRARREERPAKATHKPRGPS